jgi:flagellar motor switch protein FliG
MRDVTKEKLAKDKARDSGYRKAAQFLMLLGPDEAANVIKHLSHEEVEGVTLEIARIGKVEESDAEKILDEFGCLARSKELVAQGGLGKAREMLIAAFGDEKGETFYNKLRLKTAFQPFSFLEDLDLSQVVLLLKDESTPVVSLILAYLEPKLAGRILSSLPPTTQKDIAIRISHMHTVTPEIIQQAEQSLRDKIRSLGEIVTQEIDGRSALASILEHLDLRTEEILLDDLEGQDPELAETIRQQLFNINVVLRIRDQDLEQILRDFEDREVATVLKGKEESIKEKILQNVSSRRRELIKADYEALGEVLRRDVDKQTIEFMNYVKNRVDTGEIVLVDRDDEYVE